MFCAKAAVEPLLSYHVFTLAVTRDKRVGDTKSYHTQSHEHPFAAAVSLRYTGCAGVR